MEIDLMPSKVSNDATTMIYAIDATGAVTVKLRQQDGHNVAFRNSFKNLKEDAYIEKLENENNKIEIQEYSRTNQKNLLYQLLKESSLK
jgi:hypothetical protein